MKSLKKISLFGIALSLVLLLGSYFNITACAIDRGAYIVPLSVSYVHPVTGQTVDGGTNIELGQSMCESITSGNVLVESTGETNYVTMTIGLMSNISSVKIMLVNGEEYTEADLTQTGSGERSGDSCNYYRFEMKDLTNLISPVLYVDPMGREVQFFVSLNPEEAAEGTGEYLSEMLTEPEPQETKEAEQIDEKLTKEQEEAVDTEEETVSVSEPEEAKTKGSSSAIPIVVVIGLIVIGAIFFVIKRKKRNET